jgi:hypothetical protein
MTSPGRRPGEARVEVVVAPVLVARMKNTCTQACPPSMWSATTSASEHGAGVDALRGLHLGQRLDAVASAAARSNSMASAASCIWRASVS